MFAKLENLLETSMEVLSAFMWAIWDFFEGYTLLPMSKLILKAAMYIIKFL